MTTTTRDEGWRIVDIVVAAVIAVAFGVVFIAWNTVYAATEPLFAALPPAQALMYGIWLLPAVLVFHQRVRLPEHRPEEVIPRGPGGEVHLRQGHPRHFGGREDALDGADGVLGEGGDPVHLGLDLVEVDLQPLHVRHGLDQHGAIRHLAQSSNDLVMISVTGLPRAARMSHPVRSWATGLM